ncbi:hypothetical protein ANPL_04600 [Anaplasma platys]|uniref:Uncharacterized protein n=1 Tax=Anaplasma platys TaxID=949 RepID=A0A858PZB2_9RICK|nr:hypothetical protein ANPL_04600 [Anaplasma platys]
MVCFERNRSVMGGRDCLYYEVTALHRAAKLLVLSVKPFRSGAWQSNSETHCCCWPCREVVQCVSHVLQTTEDQIIVTVGDKYEIFQERVRRPV